MQNCICSCQMTVVLGSATENEILSLLIVGRSSGSLDGAILTFYDLSIILLSFIFSCSCSYHFLSEMNSICVDSFVSWIIMIYCKMQVKDSNLLSVHKGESCNRTSGNNYMAPFHHCKFCYFRFLYGCVHEIKIPCLHNGFVILILCWIDESLNSASSKSYTTAGR